MALLYLHNRAKNVFLVGALFALASNQVNQQQSTFTSVILFSDVSGMTHNPILGIEFQVHKCHISITRALSPIVTQFLEVLDNSEQ